MTKLSIEISGPGPDDEMARAMVLVGIKDEMAALVAKLATLGITAMPRHRWVGTRAEKAPAPDTAVGNGGAALSDKAADEGVDPEFRALQRGQNRHAAE